MPHLVATFYATSCLEHRQLFRHWRRNFLFFINLNVKSAQFNGSLWDEKALWSVKCRQISMNFYIEWKYVKRSASTKSCVVNIMKFLHPIDTESQGIIIEKLIKNFRRIKARRRNFLGNLLLEKVLGKLKFSRHKKLPVKRYCRDNPIKLSCCQALHNFLV